MRFSSTKNVNLREGEAPAEPLAPAEPFGAAGASLSRANA
jgi:hypothetical protein